MIQFDEYFFWIFLKLWCLDGIPTYGWSFIKKPWPWTPHFLHCSPKEIQVGLPNMFVTATLVLHDHRQEGAPGWWKIDGFKGDVWKKRLTRYGDSTKLCWDYSCYIIFSYNIYFGTRSTFHSISTSITHSFPWLDFESCPNIEPWPCGLSFGGVPSLKSPSQTAEKRSGLPFTSLKHQKKLLVPFYVGMFISFPRISHHFPLFHIPFF